jgi:hypothetical protein
MDFGKALSYAFEDEDWFTKIGLGAVISLVPILNFAINGYMVRIIHSVAQGNPRPLPAWDELGDYFLKGLYVFVAQLAYGLIPGILFSISLPLFIIPIVAVEDSQATLGVGAGLIAGSCALLLGIVFAIGLGLLLLAGIIRFSAGRQEIAELFQVGENWNYLRTNFSTIIMAIVYVVVIGFLIVTLVGVLGFVLSIIPCCGQLVAYAIGFVVGFLATIIGAHLYGQAARVTGLGASAAPPV